MDVKKDKFKTKAQLIDELTVLRRRVRQLEKCRPGCLPLEGVFGQACGIHSLVLNNTVMGIVFVRNRIFEWVNSRFHSLLGMPGERIVGSGTRLIYASDDMYEEKGRVLYMALSRGEWSEMELDVSRADGMVFTARIVGKALDPACPDEGSIWIFEDITGRKRAEEGLRESEEKYRTVAEKANEGIMIAQDDCFAYVNPKMAADILEMPAEMLTDKPFSDYIHPEDRDMVISRHRRRLAGESLPDSYEFRIIGRTKKITWVCLSANCIQWNGRPATLNLFTDVTERKQAEAALKESEAKYRRLVDNSYDLIWTVDADGVFTFISPAWGKTLGYEPSDLIGKSFLPFMHPDDADACIKTIMDGILLKNERQCVVYRVKHANGTWLWHEASGTPVFGPDGAFLSFVGVSRNIDERKQAEDALKKSQSTLSSIVEFLPDAAIVIDLDGRIIAWNRAMEKMTQVSKEEAVGREKHSFTTSFYGTHRKYLLDFIDSSDPEIDGLYRHVERKGNTLLAEVFAPALYGGRGAHIFAAAAPLYDDRGNRFGVIELMRDVTELRRAEDDLREAHRRLDEIIENLPDATLVIDAEGQVIAWNRAMEQMTGIAAADMLGKGKYEYALPFYGKRRPMLIDLALNSQRRFEAKYIGIERMGAILMGEAYMPALRGGDVCLSGRASILRDSKGQVIGAVESILDITERRKAEEKYRGIFDNAVMGIFHTIPEGRIIQANPAFARILGYDSPEEVVSLVTDVARQMYADPGKRTEFLQLLDTYGAVRDHELQFIRRDGNTVLVAASGRAVRDGAGKFLYYEGMLQDITEHRQLEAQLRQAQKMEAIGTLAGGIAHDFNNILGGIMGYTELVMSHHIGPGHPAYKFLEGALRSSLRAKDLVAQMMIFSRRQEQKKFPLNMRPIVKEAMKLLRASLPATIRIASHIDAADCLVLADPTQVHQILMNLVTNSAYAMKDMTGTIEITLHPCTFGADDAVPHPELKRGILYQKLVVHDTGCGIAPEHLPRIFDPFFTTKKTGEGTGLGLSVVYGIVKSYDGVITVESQPAEGATFRIFFPAVTGRDAPMRNDKVQVSGGKEHILFIDDEYTLTEIFCLQLKDLGYTVTVHNDPLRALDDFRRHPADFDLVITDMTMPDMTGADLACELLRIRPDVPVILCTGMIEKMNYDRLRRQGIRELITKPVEIRHLATTIRLILDND